MATKKSTSPARQQRRAAAGVRQDNSDVRSGIWVVHSMQDTRRIPLLGDLRHEHFYYTEGDPTVYQADYQPAAITTTLDLPGDRKITFDAIVMRQDGTRECRRVASCVLDPNAEEDVRHRGRLHAAARRHGGTLVEVTPLDLDPMRTRIWNWVRVNGAYQRAREYSLSVIEAGIRAKFARGTVKNVGDLLAALPSDSPALVLASVAKLLRERRLSSDLDVATWSRRTKLWESTV